MNIIENYNDEGLPLSKIEYGDVFQHSGSYFIRCKIDGRQEDVLQYSGNDVIVNLATGIVEHLKNDTLVIPIYARIRINGRAD